MRLFYIITSNSSDNISFSVISPFSDSLIWPVAFLSVQFKLYIYFLYWKLCHLFFICLIFISSIKSNMLFSPPPWLVLVLQNQQNVCFPSKGWQSWRTASTNQGILRQLSATACNCGGRSLITPACYCFCPPSTSSAEDLTGEVWRERLVSHSAFDVVIAENYGAWVHSWAGRSAETTDASSGNFATLCNEVSCFLFDCNTGLWWWYLTMPCLGFWVKSEVFLFCVYWHNHLSACCFAFASKHLVKQTLVWSFWKCNNLVCDIALQVGTLQYVGHQTESNACGGLLQSGECVQGAWAASGGYWALSSCSEAEARFHWWLHQPGCCSGGCRGHGGSGAGLCVCITVQPGMQQTWNSLTNSIVFLAGE